MPMSISVTPSCLAAPVTYDLFSDGLQCLDPAPSDLDPVLGGDGPFSLKFASPYFRAIVSKYLLNFFLGTGEKA